MMGWFTTESSPTHPRKTKDGTPEAPSRGQRAQCYGGRDGFFKCLDQHEIIDAIKEKDRAAKLCSEELIAFEKTCASSWVTYFKQQRLAQYIKDQQIKKLREEGAEGLDGLRQPLPGKI